MFYRVAYNEIHWHAKILLTSISGFVFLLLMWLIPLSSGQVIVASYFFGMHICHKAKLKKNKKFIFNA